MKKTTKKQTKQTKLRDQEDKARNAKKKQDDFFAKLADEAGDEDDRAGGARG